MCGRLGKILGPTRRGDAGWMKKRATKRGKNANLCHLVIPFLPVILENEKESGKQRKNNAMCVGFHTQYSMFNKRALLREHFRECAHRIRACCGNIWRLPLLRASRTTPTTTTTVNSSKFTFDCVRPNIEFIFYIVCANIRHPFLLLSIYHPFGVNLFFSQFFFLVHRRFYRIPI